MCTVVAQYYAKEVQIGGDARWRDERIVQIMKEVGGRTFRVISPKFSSEKKRNKFQKIRDCVFDFVTIFVIWYNRQILRS